MMFVLTADDPKSGQYSEDEGWQFITLGDQVNYFFSKGNIPNNHRCTFLVHLLLVVHLLLSSETQTLLRVLSVMHLSKKKCHSHSSVVFTA